MIEASLLAIVIFVIFVLSLLNDGLRRRWPAAALTRIELIFIYVLLTTSLGLAGLGQIQFLNQTLGGLFHGATPRNHWDRFFPYVPRWWVPDRSVLDAYYKGGSSFFTLDHLHGWALPVLTWCGFIVVLISAELRQGPA